MIESVAFCAPTSPPLTGASRSRIPLVARRFASSATLIGETVPITTSTSPEFIDSSKPFARTSSTCGRSGRTVSTIAESLSERFLNCVAPAATALSAGPCDLFQTSVEVPDLAKLIATGKPIAPRPITVTRSFLSVTEQTPI